MSVGDQSARFGRARRVLLAGVLAALGLPACGRDPPYEPPAPPAIAITNPTTSGRYSTYFDFVELVGTVSGAQIIRWTNDGNVSTGTAVIGPRSWFARVRLAQGLNRITFYADADGRGSSVGRAEILVTFDPDLDHEVPIIAITYPTSLPGFLALEDIVILAGSAADNSGSFDVKWVNRANGQIGLAAGHEDWQASVELVDGLNMIVVTALDRGGNAGSDSIVVIYDAPGPRNRRRGGLSD